MAPLEDEQRLAVFNTLLDQLTAAEGSGDVRTFVAEPLRYFLLKLCHGDLLSKEELGFLYKQTASSTLNSAEISWSRNVLALAKRSETINFQLIASGVYEVREEQFRHQLRVNKAAEMNSGGIGETLGFLLLGLLTLVFLVKLPPLGFFMGWLFLLLLLNR